MTPALVTLLTDFGEQDGYVAAMKGALLRRELGLTLLDISHQIPAGDVTAAAYVLLQAAPHFPAGTVHLVVVDPGVGSARRALAARIGEQLYVAPDNGVLGLVLAAASADAPHGAAAVRHVAHPDFARADASPVFHGRDLFAPTAAYLAAGGALQALGPELGAALLVRLPGEPAAADGEGWRGSVIHVDRFGNLISNIPLPVDAGPATAEVAGHTAPLARTYSDVAVGALLALRGSSGLLEVAANGAHAALLTGAARGDVVTLRAPRRS